MANKALIIGGTGFLGANLAISLQKRGFEVASFSRHQPDWPQPGVTYEYDEDSSLEMIYGMVDQVDHVYYLASDLVPATSNKKLQDGFSVVEAATAVFDYCAQQKKRLTYFSSGGAIYGMECPQPCKETYDAYPITTYALQKLYLEKMLYLLGYQKSLDYRIARIANPYGPFQRSLGLQGAIGTFVLRAMEGKPADVLGDGSIVRDYVYVEDTIEAIVRFALDDNPPYRLLNVGSGVGMSVNEVLAKISEVLDIPVQVDTRPSRQSDVPRVVLDVSRFESVYGPIAVTPLEEGIRKTADFISQYYLK